MKIAYIAGPYRADTINGIVVNIRNAEKYAIKYWKLGFAVICPHKNTALFDGILPDDTWINGGLELLKHADLLVMIPGWRNSKGCLIELEHATRVGTMVIYED